MRLVLGSFGGLLAMVPALAQAQSGGPTIAGFTLPSRRVPVAELEARAQALAAKLAAQAGGQVVDPARKPRVELAALAQARSLALSGEVDQAALLYDVALGEGARIPHRLADPASLITALIKRASISLARGESARAEALLERVLRYDPAA